MTMISKTATFALGAVWLFLASAAGAQVGDGASSAAEAGAADQQATLAERQREVARARRQLQEAQRGLETAARELARVQATRLMPRILTPDGVVLGLDGPSGLNALNRRVVLGINIENTDTGARVAGVTPGGAAADAGMRSGDIITAIDGESLLQVGHSPSEALIAALADVEPGATVTLDVSRDGATRSIEVEAREPTASAYSFLRGQGPDFTIGQRPFIVENGVLRSDLPGIFAARWRDMELVALTPALGRYFGADEGLLVVHAPDNDDLGLVDGDVILDIGGRVPSSPEHAMRILTSFAPGEQLELHIMRDRRRETLEYEIPAE